MAINRRQFIGRSALAASALLAGNCHPPSKNREYAVSEDLSREMYDKALAIAKTKIRGGPNDPVYKKPFVDAAFSSNIFYWDTCFIASYAKYHQEELPIANALDNFYGRMEDDGFICREYTKEGSPMWPKEHPVSVNPPLLAFAELELYSQSRSLPRLQEIYPKLKKHFEHWTRNWRAEDYLLFNDALGSGMDNIDRFPRGWKDDQQGIPIHNLHPEIFSYEGLNPAWNRQGRMVDVSAQYALFAKNMIQLAELTGHAPDIPSYQQLYDETKKAINTHCWNEEDGFYYDLGYNRQIKRKHIGMFWVLMAEVIPAGNVDRFLSHLRDKASFWRKIPVATTPATEPEFSPKGDYWRGSVWAPTNYMILRGLRQYGREQLAVELAKEYYGGVAEVFRKTKTFWENYAPDSFSQGNNSRPDFCGWTGIVPITVYREFLSASHSP